MPPACGAPNWRISRLATSTASAWWFTFGAAKAARIAISCSARTCSKNSGSKLRSSRRNQQPFLQPGPRGGEPDAGREPPKGPGGSARVAGQRHGSVGEGRRGGDGRSPATLRQGAAGDAEFAGAVQGAPLARGNA